MSISSRDKDGSYQRKIDEISAVISYDSDCKDARLRAVIDKAYELLILNKNSTPVSDSESEYRQKDPDYDKYLLDAAPFDTSKIAPPTPQEQPKAPSVFEYFKDHSCPYRAVVKEPSGSFSVYCQTKKIPAEVCMTQQKRYAHFDRNCRPLSKKPQAKSRSPTPAREGSKRFSMGDSEGVDSFDLGDQ